IAERRIADNSHDFDVLQLRVGGKRKPDVLPEDIAAERTSETRAHTRDTRCLRCVRPPRSTPLHDRNAYRFEKSGRHDVELRREVSWLRADEANWHPSNVVAVHIPECASVADGSHAGQCGDPL